MALEVTRRKRGSCGGCRRGVQLRHHAGRRLSDTGVGLHLLRWRVNAYGKLSSRYDNPIGCLCEQHPRWATGTKATLHCSVRIKHTRKFATELSHQPLTFGDERP